MVPWLAFLCWWFRFSTWKAFVLRVFMKPPSLDEGNCVEEPVLSSTDGSDVDGADTSLDHRRGNLADLLSRISLEERVHVNFMRNDGVHYMYAGTGDYRFNGDDGAYKEIMGAIGTSTVLKFLILHDFNGLPLILEGISEALLSNQSVEKLYLYSSDDKVIELMCRVLLKNKSLEDVHLSNFGLDTQGAGFVSSALRQNRTLKRLDLRGGRFNKLDDEAWKLLLDPLMRGDESNNVLEHFAFPCHGSAHCDVHIGNMVRKNTSLQSLEISLNDGDVAANVVCCIGEALRFNTALSRLYLYFRLGDIRRDVLKGLLTALTPDAQGQQANTTVKHVGISFFLSNTELELDSLGNMLRSNTSLIELEFHSGFKKAEDVVQLLESLKSNNCLEVLDLGRCDGVEGRRVLGTIMDLLQENHHLKEIRLGGTPLERDGSAEIIRAVLEKKAKDRLWEVGQTMTPTS